MVDDWPEVALQIPFFILAGFGLGIWFMRSKSVQYKLRRKKKEEVYPLEEVQKIVVNLGFTRMFASKLTRNMLTAGVLFRRIKE